MTCIVFSCSPDHRLYRLTYPSSNSAGETIVLDAEEQRRLLRKIDFNLMPFLCIVYGLNYLDKTTLSYASIVGFKVAPPYTKA